MEENVTAPENLSSSNNPINQRDTGPKQIAGAIILAGIIIGGAILLKGNMPVANKATTGGPVADAQVAKVTSEDRTMGNPNAKVTLVLYEDFQCPFCGAVSGLAGETDAIKYLKQNVDPNWAPFMPTVNDYAKNGKLLFVYRDYPFLGAESTQAAEAARCAGDQGKFWEYHDYLYGHQSGENQGAFSDPNLKSFAKGLGLNTGAFDQCLDGNKYSKAVADSKAEGNTAGVKGTPKGYILRDGKVVATIDGAESLSSVKPKIDAALK